MNSTGRGLDLVTVPERQSLASVLRSLFNNVTNFVTENLNVIFINHLLWTTGGCPEK